MHLIANKLKDSFDFKWIADFRDPWTNIDFYDELKLTGWADKKHRRLEKQVLQRADVCISVGDTLSTELEELGAGKCVTITNGYDESDVISNEVELDTKVSIAHIGSFTKSRNPELLLKSLKDLKQKYPDLSTRMELKLVGKVDYTITELIAHYGVSDLVRKVEYLPHDQVLLEQRKSHVLLLVVNDTPNAKGILTGKVFEYLSARRPILALAPQDGDLAKLVRSTNSGLVIAEDNAGDLTSFLESILNKEKSKFTFEKIENYSRRNLTEQLADLITTLTN
jgi:glycosyltransferase involved in cell wall biosynthesis